MTLLVFQFGALSLLVLLAGTLLTQSADQIAEVSGMGRSFAGFVLPAGATSLPELTIDSTAAMLKAADLAIGDMLGSCLFNLLILGVIDLVWRFVAAQSLTPRGNETGRFRTRRIDNTSPPDENLPQHG